MISGGYIADDFLPSITGAGVSARYLCKDLVSRGHNVCVITTRRKGQAEVESWEQVKIYRMFSIKIFDFVIALASKRALKKILLENGVDVIHYQYAGLLAMRSRAVARTLPDIKNVYTYNMTVEHLTAGSKTLSIAAGVLSRLLKKFCSSCDLVTVPSRALLIKLKKAGLNNELRYLSNAVGLENQASEISKKPFTIMYAGRLHPEKKCGFFNSGF